MSLSSLPRVRSSDQLQDASSRMNDWMRKIRGPTPYRVTNSVHLNTARIAKVGIVMLLVLTALVLLIPAADYDHKCNKRMLLHPRYNATYPLTLPTTVEEGLRYRIAVITDLDTNSKSEKKKDTWFSYYHLGYLTYDHHNLKASVKWDADTLLLESTLSQKGRGMELSELVAFNGKLYTCDDRTGLVSEITRDHKILPWVILNDGDGYVEKGI